MSQEDSADEGLAPMTRAARRRHNRECEKRGIGLGWRFTSNRKRKYPVREPPARSVEYLMRESATVIARMGL